MPPTKGKSARPFYVPCVNHRSNHREHWHTHRRHDIERRAGAVVDGHLERVVLVRGVSVLPKAVRTHAEEPVELRASLSLGRRNVDYTAAWRARAGGLSARCGGRRRRAGLAVSGAVCTDSVSAVLGAGVVETHRQRA